ncbi:MAG: AAA family ATPase [Bacteroidales bacterium]|nr:AAA family ATPase [Bacteroidales bacterium]
MEMTINKFAELSNRTLTTPAQVFGMNGAGKTTIYNAYLWCLTGKGKDGSDMNEAVYSVNDKPTERIADVEVKIGGRTFHKVCRPKYQRPRGTAEMQLQTLCSNTYELDGVEVTMKQYNDAVSVLCAGKPFQMFSDIDYFQRLDKNRQIAVIMELCGVKKSDFIGDLRDIAIIRKELDETRKAIKEEIKFNDERKSELNQVILPTDYTEAIKAKQTEIETLQAQRPTLTPSQIAENNEISKKIAELQNYPYKTISSEKRRNLNAKRDEFNALLNSRNNIVRAKIENDRLIAETEKALQDWSQNCEYNESNEQAKEINGKIAKLETLKDKDTATLEDYEQLNKEASCGICPHCDNIFCEYRKTDLPTQSDLMRNITQYQNDIAGLRAKLSEMRENWQMGKENEYKELTERLATLKANAPDIKGTDERLEILRKAVEIAEKEADEETASNDAIARENEQKRAENERKIAELKAQMHVAQVATTDNRLFGLKTELSDLQKKQKDYDEKKSVRKHISGNIAKGDATIDKLTAQSVELEREQIAYEKADAEFREAVLSKANAMLPEGMTLNLFRPLVTGDGYETTFDLTYANKKYKNTALQIWGNFEFTKMLQKAFGVDLAIFVDDIANITEDKFLPYGENVVQLVAVKGCELCIEKMNYNL